MKIVFGEQADDKTKDFTPVIIRDEYHYITRGLQELGDKGASVKGFNKVYEKSVAQLLLSTKGGKPILTVWQFGLGRVAALTTDNGLEWSQELMGVDSGKVVSGTVNWAIGDLEKGKKVRINSKDVQLGDPVELSVTSAAQPTVEVKKYETLDEPKTTLTRTGINSYAGTFTPQSTGLYGIQAVAGSDKDLDAAAVNYPREYSNLDINEDPLRRMAAAAGGRLYADNEADVLISDILGKVKESTSKEVKDPKDLWPYLAGLALLIYFLDTAIRRLIILLKREKD